MSEAEHGLSSGSTLPLSIVSSQELQRRLLDHAEPRPSEVRPTVPPRHCHQHAPLLQRTRRRPHLQSAQQSRPGAPLAAVVAACVGAKLPGVDVGVTGLGYSFEGADVRECRHDTVGERFAAAAGAEMAEACLELALLEGRDESASEEPGVRHGPDWPSCCDPARATGSGAVSGDGHHEPVGV